MKSVKMESPKLPAQRGSRRWLIRLALLIGVPVLFYYGYCWGWWGRNSLLLQYLFQCSCPPASEEARYPDNIDVIVSACKYRSSILSPSGRFVYIQEESSGKSTTYLLDLQTDEVTSMILPEGSNYFLTDELIFHSFYGEDQFILDVTTNSKYPIQNARQLQPSIYSMGNVKPDSLLQALLQIDQLYLIDDVFQPVIALSANFRTHPGSSFTFNSLDFPADEANPVEQFLQQNNITYQLIPGNFPDEILSPDGMYIARADGIYISQSDEKIVEGYSVRGLFHPYSGYRFAVQGWVIDGKSVIYSKFLNPCLVEASFFLSDEPGCFFDVPQPLLKLKVPEEYLLPELTP